MSVAVVGGGIIGLSIAHRLVADGHSVTLVDPAPGTGATTVAAGMLAPLSEIEFGHEDLLRWNLAAAARWPTWVAEVADRTGADVRYRTSGSLLVARDRDDLRRLEELSAFAADLGLAMPRRRARECRAEEPFLSPTIAGGLVADGDHSVDPRAVVDALLAALTDGEATLVRARVCTLDHVDGRVHGVTLGDGTSLSFDVVVLAAGVASRTLAEGLVALPVRPVKGERLSLRVGPGMARLERVVRGLVRGSEVYLVPRDDGEVVVGATSHDLGEDLTPTAGGVRELLRDAHEIVPGMTEWAWGGVSVGLRPATPDNGPLLGRPAAVDGLVVATGHHRNGVLQAPVTADTVAALVVGEDVPALALPFAVDRFAAPGPSQ